MRNRPQKSSMLTEAGTLLLKAGRVRSGPHNPESKNEGLALRGMALLRGIPVA